MQRTGGAGDTWQEWQVKELLTALNAAYHSGARSVNIVGVLAPSTGCRPVRTHTRFAISLV
jgi:hypothetical protein